jgi:integrase
LAPYRTKADGRWRYRVRVVVNGRTERIGGCAPANNNTKAAAQGEERAHIARLLTGQEVPKEKTVPAPAGRTVADFAATFLGASKLSNKPSSVESKDQILADHLVPFFGELELRAVTYARIEDFKVAQTEKGLKAKTVNNHLTVLRSLLVVAQKRGELAGVPEFEWMKVPKPDPDFLSFEEAERLAMAADGEWGSMVRVGLQTGLRQGELLGLRWEDVDLVKGEVRVRQSYVRGRMGTPKNGKGREVPLPETALQALKRQRHLRGPLVWCDEVGKPLVKGACKHPLYRACRVAGLRRIGWHVLRHTYASHLVMHGTPLKLVQEYLGHSTIEMTMRYAHLSPEAKSRASVACLDRWAGKTVGKESHGR